MFKSKNYDSILTRIKAVHGLEHDATEAEIDQHLADCPTYEEVKANAKAEAENGVKDQVDAAKAAQQAAENRAEKAESDLTAVQSDLTATKSGLAETQRQLDAANKKILELEKEPAAPHTNGPTDPPEPKTGTRAYDLDPVTQRARKMIRR